MCTTRDKQINRAKCRSTTLRIKCFFLLSCVSVVVVVAIGCARPFAISLIPIHSFIFGRLFVYISLALHLFFFKFYYYITSIVSRQISFNNLLMYATTIYVNKKCRPSKLQLPNEIMRCCMAISRKFRR